MLSFAEFLAEDDHVNKNKRFIEYICKQIKKKIPSFKVISPISIKVDENYARGYVTVHIDNDSVPKDSNLISKMENYLRKQRGDIEMYPFDTQTHLRKTFKKNFVQYYIGYVLGFNIGEQTTTTISWPKKKYAVVTDFEWIEIEPTKDNEYQLIFKTGYTLHDRKDPNKNNWPKHDRRPVHNKKYDDDDEDEMEDEIDWERDVGASAVL